MIKTTNIILSAKGGVGKTYIACNLAEYLFAHDVEFTMLDTDATNEWLTKSRFFKATKFDLKDSESLITSEKLPELAITFANQNLIIDTGSNSYGSWISFLKNNSGIDILQSNGNKLVLHVVIPQGQMEQECISCLKDLCSLEENVAIVVWLNNAIASGITPLTLKNFYEDVKDQSILSKIQFVIDLPQCNRVDRVLVNKLHDKNLCMTDILLATNSELEKIIFTNGKHGNVVDKVMSKNYQKKIFDAIDIVKPLYVDEASENDENQK